MSVSMSIRQLGRSVLVLASAMIFALPLAFAAGKPVPVTVTAANPSEAIQGQELDVLVSGTGFGAGSTVKYLVTGTTDASQVTVLSVAYLPATGQLKTHIKVNGEAVTNYYDIEVLAATGRKGKGTTLFKVNQDPTVILPISLGVPTGCGSSSGTGLNDGAYPAALIVTGAKGSCTTGINGLYRWQNGIWYALGSLGTGFNGVARGVSNDGTVAGMFANTSGITAAVVVNSADAMEVLPLLPGLDNSEAYGISEDGRHVLGSIRYIPIGDYSEWLAARWNLDLAGNWNIELISPQQSYIGRWSNGSSDDGSVIAGLGSYNGLQPDTALADSQVGWVWMEGAPPEWQNLGLDTQPYDVSPGGEMIVGRRLRHNADTALPTLAMYWILDSGGNWVSHDLMGLDAEGSTAWGVGMVNGKLVIVGYGTTGSSRITRAVTWLPRPDGSYGAPIRLAAIDGKSSVYSWAEDVNANGVVTGISGILKSSNSRAVLWMLPVTP